MTIRLGITPTSSCARGARHPVRGLPKTSQWEVSTERLVAESIDVYQLADDLVSKLEGNAVQIIEAIEELGLYAVLEVVLYFSTDDRVSTPAIGFSSRVLAFLANVGATIDIDTYLLPEGEIPKLDLPTPQEPSTDIRLQSTPSITGVAEFVLNVADLEKSRDFYRRILGFSLHSELSLETTIPNPAGKPTICFLTICETNTPLGHGGHPQLLVLIDYRRHVHARSRFSGHDATQSTLNHLAFEIPPSSFDAHAKRLRGFGIDLSFSEFPAMNARAMFFKDPDCNTIELICNKSNELQEHARSS